VKHYFRYLVTGAVLLVALIIFNDKKSELPSTGTETPEIEQVELLAELCSTPFARFTDPSYWLSAIVKEFFSGRFKIKAFKDFASPQTLLKAQIRIYLEHKSDLEFQSDQYLHHHTSREEPPLT